MRSPGSESRSSWNDPVSLAHGAHIGADREDLEATFIARYVDRCCGAEVLSWCSGGRVSTGNLVDIGRIQWSGESSQCDQLAVRRGERMCVEAEWQFASDFSQLPQVIWADELT